MIGRGKNLYLSFGVCLKVKEHPYSYSSRVRIVSSAFLQGLDMTLPRAKSVSSNSSRYILPRLLSARYYILSYLQKAWTGMCKTESREKMVSQVRFKVQWMK